MILTPLQKLTKNVGDLGKIIVAKGFKKLPKVQKIAQSGHTGADFSSYNHEVTMPKAKFKPTLPKKFGLEGEQSGANMFWVTFISSLTYYSYLRRNNYFFFFSSNHLRTS